MTSLLTLTPQTVLMELLLDLPSINGIISHHGRLELLLINLVLFPIPQFIPQPSLQFELVLGQLKRTSEHLTLALQSGTRLILPFPLICRERR